MSKLDKTTKSSSNGMLKRDVGIAVKALQTVSVQFEVFEDALANAGEAIAKEKQLKDMMQGQQREIEELKRQNREAKAKYEAEINSLTDNNLALGRRFEARLERLKVEHELYIKQKQQQEIEERQKWKVCVETEKKETRSWKERFEQIQRDRETHIRLTTVSSQKEVSEMQQKLKMAETETANLRKQNEKLKSEIKEFDAMLKGRDTEYQRLNQKIARLEAFPLDLTVSGNLDVFTNLQGDLKELCRKCLDCSDTLLPWVKLPETLQQKELPKLFSPASAAGRRMLEATMAHAICQVLAKEILLPYGPGIAKDFQSTSAFLRQENHSHEEIWRLLSLQALSHSKDMSKRSVVVIEQVADRLISSWKPFLLEEKRAEIIASINQFFNKSVASWVELRKNRIPVGFTVDTTSEMFEPDSDDESFKIEGGIAIPDSTSPVLCLFPAFYLEALPDQNIKSSVLCLGQCMFRDSPPLVTALAEEANLYSRSKKA